MPTFDGDNLLIILDSAVTSVDAKVDLYSDWKEWLKTGTNARYPVAFDTVGGDPISGTLSVAPYFFLRNDLGWRIRPAEEDANLTIVGNLYGRDGSLPIFTSTVGNYTVLITVDRSASALVVGVSQAGVAADVWNALLANHTTPNTTGEALQQARDRGPW